MTVEWLDRIRYTWIPVHELPDESGDTILVAAPGVGKRLRIGLLFFQNTTTTDVTALFKSGNLVWDSMTMGEKDGKDRYFTQDKEILCPENTAFSVNLSASVQVRVNIWYRVEVVE